MSVVEDENGRGGEKLLLNKNAGNEGEECNVYQNKMGGAE